MRKFIPIITILTVLAAFTAGFAQSQPPKINNEAFVAKILTPLSASANKKGDKFTLQVLEPQAYAGAIIEAEVAKAKASGKISGKSELLFSFTSLTLKDGTMVPIVATLKAVTNSKGVAEVDDEGHAIGKSATKKKLFSALALGAAGAAIGGAVGGGSGAAQGAAIGAAVGMTIAFSTKGPDIKFEPGSQFQLLVSNK